MSQTLTWFEDTVMLGTTDTWEMAPHEFIDFGDANQAYVVIEALATGPLTGTDRLELDIQRSATRETRSDLFESMLATPLQITTAGRSVLQASFGADAAVANLYPRGIGRIAVSSINAGTGTVWLRVSIALVTG